MKIIDLYKKDFVISFELFPPKTEAGINNLMNEISLLAKYNPGFISVTYGAGGSTRDKTLDIALALRNRFNIEPLVHFTCVGAGREDIKDYICVVKSHGLNNILALRGDPPQGTDKFIPPADGFSYASELVSFITSLEGFCIGVAGYPEGHVEALSFDADIDNLKRKIDAGAEFVITQLFFDNSDYLNFVERAAARGINVPIIPGIMPVTNLAQLTKISGMFNPKIPAALKNSLDSSLAPDEMRKRGIDFTINQCAGLKKASPPGFHFYPLNKADAVSSIIESI